MKLIGKIFTALASMLVLLIMFAAPAILALIFHNSWILSTYVITFGIILSVILSE